MNAFAGTTDAPTRRVAPSHRPWEPWGYQTRAVAFLMGHSNAALFLDPGLGKTAIVLAAFQALKANGHAERMLVVAPLRVCQLVWRQEGAKWSQFRDLTFSLLHGPKKAERLREDTDIHLINPEGVPWLVQQFFGRSLPWDTVVLDELTKFKNHRAQRSKKLRKALRSVQRRWGLTGSPAPNGYMDLFGQMLMLDDGAALGRHITHYRDSYFQPAFNGFSYELRRGMGEKIEERIAPYVLRMAADDYIDLPPVRDNVIEIELPPDALRKYREMERDMILALPEGVVTGANSGAVYSKLAQMANGAVYLSERDGEYVEVHDAKLAALEDLIEELSGQPLLVGYEFQHDLDRIRSRLGKDTPTLSGLSEKRTLELEAAWNRGEIPVLLAHPASVAHGLNLQGSAAAHVCWFSPLWDLELYEQFIRRLRRQGSEASHITNHILRVRGTLDDVKAEALGTKDVTQQGLLKRLNAEILRDAPASTAARAAQHEEDAMAVRKLGFRNPAEDQPAEATNEAPVRPRGWGAPPAEAERAEQPSARRPAAQEEPVRPKGWGPPAGAAVDPQREEIRSKISAPAPQPAAQGDDEDEEVPASVRALQAFPAGIVQALEGDDESESAEDVPQQRTAATETQPVQPKGWGAPAAHAPAEMEEVVRQNMARQNMVDPWAGLSTRTKNVLEGAGLTSAEQAYSFGKDELFANVKGFGEKGWEELEALFGGGGAAEEEGVEPVKEPLKFMSDLIGAVDGPGTSKESSQQTATPRDSAAPTAGVLIHIEVTGLDGAGLHALFSTLANRYAVTEG